MSSTRSKISAVIDRAAYLRRSIGIWGALRRVVAKLVAPIIQIDRAHIAMHYYKSGVDPERERSTDDAKGTHSIVATTEEDLEAIRDEMDGHYDWESVRDFLRSGPSRFLVLSRRPRDGGGFQVIGLRLCERGVFSIWDDRVHIDLPPNYVMTHLNDVHPRYRGQRVSLSGREGLYDYAMKNGIDRTVSIIATHNASSIKASNRSTAMIRARMKGEIRRVRLLGGMINWITPLDTIRALIEAPEDDRDRSGSAEPDHISSDQNQ